MNDTPTADYGPGFIETLFGVRVDHARILREQAVCVTCGEPGFHAHVIASAVDQGDE